jgi:hypothetical protein
VTRRAVLGAALLPGLARADTPSPISFDALYKSFGVTGYVFSARLTGLTGKPVAITGYLAPPLKAESKFFVLTREPLALCPFCQSDADWPVDIVVVYLRRVSTLLPAGVRLTVQGRLDLGSWTDPETGFVSQLRVVDASFTRA